MARKRIGRPPKLTTDVQTRIEQALRAGNYREVAARFAGVSSRTVKQWYAEGKKHSAKGRTSQFKDFYAAVNKAEADAETLVVGRLMAAAQTDVKAMAFWLERKHSKRWGRKDALKAEVKDVTPPPADGPTPQEKLKALIIAKMDAHTKK